jgi:hypothetical protein
MKAIVTSLAGDTTELECKDMVFEGGFIVFQREEEKELFISPVKVAMMEITGRPKKKEVKTKKEA